MKAKTLAKILACVLGMAVMIVWMVFISGGFSKKLVSNSPAEVPGGCIDVYLTGEPWSSDIQIGEFRPDGFVEIGHLGGTFHPHSVRIPVGVGQHYLRIGYYPYGQPAPKPGVFGKFTEERKVDVGAKFGRRIHVHDNGVGSKQTGLRSFTIYQDFHVDLEPEAY